MLKKYLIIIGLGLSLSGCASQIPELIKNKPETDLNYVNVKKNIDGNINHGVRWGGKIISVENKPETTWIEILAKPLDKFGEPVDSDDFYGRFIAIINTFLDPEQYSKDRNITIYGILESKIIRNIDDHPYTFPIVRVSEYHLWPKYLAAHHRYPYNLHYHPFYFHRFYPFHYGYPYYHPFYRYRFRHHH